MREYIKLIIRHYKTMLDMAKTIKEYGRKTKVKDILKEMVEIEEGNIEIAEDFYMDYWDYVDKYGEPESNFNDGFAS